LFERDSYYIDKLIELKNETGYPKKFQASFAKNNSQRIFEIGLKLSENGMNKGVTLAFQSMSPDALKIIGRTNITVDFFKELMNKYNEAHIPTYTELILGLPGETYDSFAGGIDELLEAGQHHSIYIHNCELLPGSDLGDPEFIKKYDIKANIIPLNQPHMSFLHADSIPEYSRIVTSTFSMNEEDWIKTNIFSDFVQCFHHLGMLEFFALYSYFELGIKYRVFFENLIEYFRSRKEGFVHSVIADIESRYRKIIDGNGELTAHDDRFGDVLWSFDEFAFLNIIDNFRGFYKEAKGYLETLGIEKDILENLLEFQIIMLKKPGDKSENELECDYDFLKYFSTAFLNEKPVLEKRKTHYKISGAKTYDSIADYARFVVWYGRKDSRNIYDKDVRTV
jgi:putative methyltransferase